MRRSLSASLSECVALHLAASYIPNPFAVMYGTTKAAVSAFAASLAVEARARGIHVHAIHPSPVNSRFSAGGGNQIQNAKIQAMDSFYKFASGPEVIRGVVEQSPALQLSKSVCLPVDG